MKGPLTDGFLRGLRAWAEFHRSDGKVGMSSVLALLDEHASLKRELTRYREAVAAELHRDMNSTLSAYDAEREGKVKA